VNPWFRHPLFKEGEDKSIEADRLDRQNQRDLAMTLHFQAAEAFAKLAQLVSGDHAHERSDIAIAAAVSYGCAGHYDRAVKFAELMLAQQGALSARGRGELTKIIEEYAPIVRLTTPTGRLPARRAGNGPHRMRDYVRGRSEKPEAA
jgi:hypothetical protein